MTSRLRSPKTKAKSRAATTLQGSAQPQGPQPTQSPLLEAARRYVDLGLSVIPLGNDKKAAANWTPYQAHKATDQELMYWFGKGRHPGVAVVFGEVSQNLACRDFDQPESYFQWCAQHADLADHLPTVKTPRGYHVYFRVDPADLASFRRQIGKPHGIGAIDLTDGEVRVDKCYCVLPPTQLSTGHTYRWIREIVSLDKLPVLGLETSGLARCYRVDREHRADRDQQKSLKRGCSVESSPQLAASLEQPGQHSTDETGPLQLSAQDKQKIEAAITRTLPTKFKTREGKIWDFVRILKGIPALASRDPLALSPLIQEWFERALPNIETKDFAVTYTDFLEAWHDVRFPVSDEPLAEIYHQAISTPPPGCSKGFLPEMQQLISLCRALQSLSPEPFFLSCRTAGRLVGKDHTLVARWLKELCRRGILELVRQGGPENMRASRYRYRGD